MHELHTHTSIQWKSSETPGFYLMHLTSFYVKKGTAKTTLRPMFQPHWIPASQQKRGKKGPLSRATWLQGPEIEPRLPGLSIHIFILHNNTPAKATALAQNSHIQRQTESATPTPNNKATPQGSIGCTKIQVLDLSYCIEANSSSHYGSIVSRLRNQMQSR